jgi:hypothetical protein
MPFHVRDELEYCPFLQPGILATTVCTMMYTRRPERVIKVLATICSPEGVRHMPESDEWMLKWLVQQVDERGG